MRRLAAIILGLLTSSGAGLASDSAPQQDLADAVIYVGGGFQAYTRGGRPGEIVPCTVPVQDFSVAPDGRSVVFTSVEDAHAGAGLLYRLDLTNGRIEKLVEHPLYFKSAEPEDRELYAVPETSPDGRSVAFAVRAVAGDESDDAIGLAGPIGIMNLRSKETRILRGSENVDGQGPPYVSSMAWSPDRTRLLLESQPNGALARVDRGKLRWLDGLLPVKYREGEAAPLAWWSNSVVLFIWSPEALWRASTAEIFSLNLKTKAFAETGMLRQRAPLRNVGRIDCNRQFLLITHEGGAELLTRTGGFVQHWPTSKVRLRFQ